MVLVGFMGAGKSTVGPLLAARLGCEFLDLDRVVETRAGCSVAELFATAGEAGFRQREQAALTDVLADVLVGAPVVLALGGGALEDARNRSSLAGSRVVHLAVELDEALRRVGADPGRPLLADPDLPRRYAGRLGHYAAVAELTVPTSGRSAEQVADLIVAGLADPTGGDSG